MTYADSAEHAKPGFWRWMWGGMVSLKRSARLPRGMELFFIGMISCLAVMMAWPVVNVWLSVWIPVGLLIALYGVYQDEMKTE